MLDKPDADDMVRKPVITCPDKKCPDNLFGYCQSKPDLDETGKCKRIFGGIDEDRHKRR